MPDYNPAVALDLKPPENSLAQTFNTIANLQQTQAHTGLYQLQAQQQARQYNALQQAAASYRGGQDPTAAYLAAGGDPAGANTLQTVFAGQRAMAATPGGLMPQAFEQLTGAAKNRQETSNLGVQHQVYQTDLAKKDMEFRGGAAQSMFNDPGDENWNANAANLRGHVSPQGWAQIQGAKTPEQRKNVAQSMIDAATPTQEFVKPVPMQPGEGFTTVGRLQARPAPGPSGAAASPMVVPPTTLMGKKEQEQYGETLGKEPGTLAEKAEGARQQNFTLEQMKAESASWPMGKGAKPWMVAQQYMKPFANAFGSTAFDQPVADYESFEKNTGTLVRQAVKEVSSRAAVQEFNMIQKQLPSAEMTRQGFHQIATQFQSVNDYQIAKQQAAQTWRDTHGTMDKFDSDWNKNITPTAFLVHRMTPEQLHQVAANLQGTADGRAVLGSIKRQMEYAQHAGLF